MPNGISGQDLLRRGARVRPEMKALFTSGYSEQFIAGPRGNRPGRPAAAKPYRRQKLTDIIRSVLDRTA